MKKVFKCCFAVLLLVVTMCGLYKYNNQQEIGNNKIVEENNKKNIFIIDKIIAYSNANAKKNENNQRADWELSIYQYTDLAIYIKINQTDDDRESNIKSISIENMKILQNPKLGTPVLGAKKIRDFGKDENEIKESISNINFELLEKQDSIENSEYPFKKDGSIPLTITYFNNNIKEKYIISDITQALTFDGSLLRRARIPIDAIKSKIGLTVKIVNELQEEYTATVEFDLPITEELYEGSQTVIIDSKQEFEIF